MSEIFCCVSVEDDLENEIRTIADFPLRIHNIGACQILAHALQSKELYQLVIRNGVKIPLKVFSHANLKGKRVNGWAVGEQNYNAVVRLKDFISQNKGYQIRIYAHWANHDEALEDPV